MTTNLDELDQTLMEAIVELDVRAVKSGIRAGASVLHTRQRENMPVGPMITPVMLAHRMQDVLANPEVKIIRKFPTRVLALLKDKLQGHAETLGEAEVKDRVDEICRLIVKKMTRR